ncbi:GNAT family N-acetyltransferase [Streptomyces griseorubiginosus]|uniref:GNAT family N-acetyltransferase n=1 Tax=Streptomyces griseorubiginosus TaxID=67304 RepID=UPI0036E652D9
MPTPLTTATPQQAIAANAFTHPHTQTVTRPADLDDLDGVNALHERCSLQTRFARYQAARRSLRLTEFQHLTRPDHSLTWVTYPMGDPHQLVATTNLVRTADAGAAELGIMIEDSWQNRGLGTALVRYARTQARALGCSTLVVMTSSDNVRVLKIMRALGATLPAIQGSTVDLMVPVG